MQNRIANRVKDMLYLESRNIHESLLDYSPSSEARNEMEGWSDVAIEIIGSIAVQSRGPRRPY